MRGSLTVLCAGLAFSWVAVAGAQPRTEHPTMSVQAQSNAGQSGSEQAGSGQSTTAESGSSSSRSRSRSSREVTLTGCLEQGSNANTYVLRNVTEEQGGSASGYSSQGTSGSSQGQQTGMSGEQGSQGSMQSGQSGMDFQLVGKNLSKYVGKRVQVRGKIEPMRERGESGMSNESGSAGSTGSQGTSGTQSGSQSGSSMGGGQSGQSASAGLVTHRVKVASIKQLGSSCQ